MAKKFYVTTAIDYVNAEPHIGHAFEKVIADALVRWHKQKGENVFFLTGVDENAQKNVLAAEAAGVSVKDFVDKNTGFFLELCRKLNISYNKFIRTSAREHAKVVQKILKKISDKGDIYKGEYEGYYCVGCEAYISEKDLVDGKCPEHNKKPEYLKEQAYFFKLSKYQDKLIKFAEKYIVPESKKKEILVRLKQGLKDVCITRKDAKWGIDFPLDKNYKVWVWIDALINYISGAEKQWPADVHVIGKGINWFHSVIWPAILISAGYKLPDKLLVHGYLISGGKKMSKSLGNVVSPLELLDKYSADSIRYALLRCNIFEDSDFNEELLIARHNNELANKLGNLVSRVAALAEKYGLEEVNFKKIDVDISVSNIVEDVSSLIKRFEFDKALNLIFAFIDTLNQWVQNEKIWETGSKKDLFELATGIKTASILLWPFIPETSEKIAKQFGFKVGENTLKEIEKPLKVIKIKKSEILFKKI